MTDSGKRVVTIGLSVAIVSVADDSPSVLVVHSGPGPNDGNDA